MANPNHIKILKQGVEFWNNWREENPDIMPELSEVDLSGTVLSKANLSGTNLHGANLTKADLGAAEPSEANLSCKTKRF
jgi:uncharacterized protein YjbI with pentapeptide repeats